MQMPESSSSKEMPKRTRKKGLPEKKERPCPRGCTEFTKLGVNAYAITMTCLDCGFGHNEKIENKP
eukprot:7440688-Karenia_brevis.AAC.1